jgi:hypothetical protein
MDRHDYTLVHPAPGAQSGPGFDWALGVDNAVSELGQASSKRISEKNFVPIPVPEDTGRSADSLQHEWAESENGVGQQPPPGERRDEPGAGATFRKVLA